MKKNSKFSNFLTALLKYRYLFCYWHRHCSSTMPGSKIKFVMIREDNNQVATATWFNTIDILLFQLPKGV
jgi:hypothetical protein